MPFLLNTTEVTDPAANRPLSVAAFVRPVECNDIPAIKHFYDRYVRETAAAFEIEAPDQAEMERRWRLKEVEGKFGRLIDILLMQRALGGGE